MTRFLLFSTAAVLLLATPAAALQGSYCSPRDETPGEHGFGTFFDSAGVAGVIEREWNPEWGILFGYLAPDSTDAMGSLSLYSTSDDPAGVERIAAWLQAFRSTAPFPDSLPVALMLAEDEEIRPRSITHLEQCAPRMLDAEAVQKRLTAATREPTFRSSSAYRSSRPARTVVRLYVGSNGGATEYRLHQSSGFDDWDRLASRVAVGIEFVPASIEGVPVPVWVQIPFGLNRTGSGQRAPSMGWWAGDPGRDPGGTLPR